MSDEPLVELRRYLSPFEAAQLCRVLADSGIQAHQVGNMANAYPSILQRGNSQDVRVLVSGTDEGQARIIADEMFPVRSDFAHLRAIPWLPNSPAFKYVALFLLIAGAITLYMVYGNTPRPEMSPYKIDISAPEKAHELLNTPKPALLVPNHLPEP